MLFFYYSIPFYSSPLHFSPLHSTHLHSRRVYCDLFGKWKNMNNPASVLWTHAPITPYLATSISTCSKGHVIERA